MATARRAGAAALASLVALVAGALLVGALYRPAVVTARGLAGARAAAGAHAPLAVSRAEARFADAQPNSIGSPWHSSAEPLRAHAARGALFEPARTNDVDEARADGAAGGGGTAQRAPAALGSPSARTTAHAGAPLAAASAREPGAQSPSGSPVPPVSPFSSSRWVRRQEFLWRKRCPCEASFATTRAPALYRDLPKVLVLDLRDAKWNGLGNSLPRWVDMLRFGAALGRATFLLMSDCALDGARAAGGVRGAGAAGAGAAGAGATWDLAARRAHESSEDALGECQFDLGAYYGGAAGVRWRWDGASRARVHAAMRARGVREARRHWCNYSEAQARALVAEPHPGCTTPPPPRAGLGGRCRFARCMEDTARWLLDPTGGGGEAWLYLDGISQLDAAMFAPMRRTLPAGADCTDGHAWGRPRDFACPHYGWLQPLPSLQAQLAPYVRALDARDAVVTVHVRSRFVDFAGQAHGWERRVPSAFAPRVAGWTAAEHVDAIEAMLRECEVRDHLRVAAPCAFHKVEGGRAHERDHKDDAFLDDPTRCGDAEAAAAWTFATRHNGPIARALTCAGRLAHALARGREPVDAADIAPWWAERASADGADDGAGRPPAFWRRAGRAPGASGGARADGDARWGLFVMSDTPAVMQLVNASSQLAARALVTRGAFAHNTFGRACERTDGRGVWLGCERREDPGGGWTRIMLDLTIASLTDGLVGVPQSTFQDAVHMRSFTTKTHFLAFHFITRPWTRREFRQGIVDVLQGVAQTLPADAGRADDRRDGARAPAALASQRGRTLSQAGARRGARRRRRPGEAGEWRTERMVVSAATRHAR